MDESMSFATPKKIKTDDEDSSALIKSASFPSILPQPSSSFSFISLLTYLINLRFSVKLSGSNFLISKEQLQ